MKTPFAIDPASFVTRGKKYMQLRGYPDFCVRTTHELCRQRPTSFNDVCAIISDMMLEARLTSNAHLFNENKGCKANVYDVPRFYGNWDRQERYKAHKAHKHDDIAFFGEMRPIHDQFMTPLTEGNRCAWDHYGKTYLRRNFPLRTLGGSGLPVYFRPKPPETLAQFLHHLGTLALALTKAIPLNIPPAKKCLQPEFSHELAVDAQDTRFTERLPDGSEKPLHMVFSHVRGKHLSAHFQDVYLIATEQREHYERDESYQITDASLDNAEARHEQRWALLQQNFLKALKVGKHFADVTYEEQVEAAASCYWMISHIMPYYRGTSTLARITLEYLAQDVGFTTPLCKQEMDLNLEALTCGHDEFVHHLTSDILKDTHYFADRRATSESVMTWHHQRLQPQAATALSL